VNEPTQQGALTMQRTYGVGLLVVLAVATACERRDHVEPVEEPSGPLTLAVETPEPLDWGGSGLLRITLANEGDATAAGGIVEVHVPDWLEFGSVEPPGTAVTVVSGETETRLSYQMTDSLPPGERRTVIQHLRVLYPARPPAQPNDTIETVRLAPANQLVRARLLTPTGEPAGAEVQVTLHFVGAPDRHPATPAIDTLPADTGAARRAQGDTGRVRADTATSSLR
jgi:hypothetical protein